jgi:hypothetical protein
VQESIPVKKEDGNRKGLGSQADSAEAAEKKSKPESVDGTSISHTLPMLLRELGQGVMDGAVSRDSAFSRGKI